MPGKMCNYFMYIFLLHCWCYLGGKNSQQGFPMCAATLWGIAAHSQGCCGMSPVAHPPCSPGATILDFTRYKMAVPKYQDLDTVILDLKRFHEIQEDAPKSQKSHLRHTPHEKPGSILEPFSHKGGRAPPPTLLLSLALCKRQAASW